MGQRGRPAARTAVALLTTLLLAACGHQATGGAGGRAVRSASLILDFTPNAIHSGIYTAIARRYDRQSGVALHVIIPGESTDAITLLIEHRVDFAILDIHDLAIARADGQPLVGVMAIVERPLASVIAQPSFATPRALDGRLIGVTGDPSDLAVLRSVVSGGGGRPSSLKTVTIGYDAVADLLSGRVAAATAFWNDEGVTLDHTAGRGHFHIFRVENYGAPPYPELVVCATSSFLRSHASLARGLVHALVRGYQAVLADPQAGAAALESEVSGLSPSLVSEQLAGELPAFRDAGGQVGGLDPATLAAWAKWEARFGIVKRPPDVRAMFDSAFLPT
jgi:ABC-type nitrate/sulfonate/bicarbonate transport system substrate-binding protein